MDPVKYFCAVLFILGLIDLSRNASLSIYEQKKYKQLIEGQGLYSADDDVEILTKANFKRKIYGRPYAYIVEFYNSWCGFCQRFAPSWKALAADTKEWQGVVNIAAVDCSDDENSELCRDFEIMAYPTLRYFHENYQEGPKNIGDDVPKGADMESHKSYLVRHMVMEQQAGRGKEFPILLPYEKPSLLNLFDQMNVNAKYGFLIIDEPTSTLGGQLALDFHAYKQIGIRYATTTNADLVKALAANKFPFMIVITDQNKSHVFSDKLSTREALRSAIIEYVKPDIQINTQKANPDIFTGKWIDVKIPDIGTLMEAKIKRIFQNKVRQLGDTVFQVDLESALRYSLKHEIGTARHISDEKLNALENYVQILIKYFPFEANGKRFLSEILRIVKSNSEVDGQSIANVVAKYDEEGGSNRAFKTNHQWISCEGSTPKKRGYPCGLWKMFHYLTVQGSYNEAADPKEVLQAMHGYIKHFFGCDDCSKHFQQLAIAKDLESVTSRNSAVLWLWMAHNDVNKRLAGDITEDPEYPKIQFPSKERCPRCRVQDSENGWDYDEVLKYVKNMYSHINQLKYEGEDEVKIEPNETTTGFPQFDTSYL